MLDLIHLPIVLMTSRLSSLYILGPSCCWILGGGSFGKLPWRLLATLDDAILLVYVMRQGRTQGTSADVVGTFESGGNTLIN